jgi:hypothetical protein
MNMMKQLAWLGDRVSDIDYDGILRTVGLARRRSMLSYVIPTVGALIAGAAIGAGVGLLFAPASGRRTRQNVEDKISHLKEKIARTHNGHSTPDLGSSYGSGSQVP